MWYNFLEPKSYPYSCNYSCVYLQLSIFTRITIIFKMSVFIVHTNTYTKHIYIHTYIHTHNICKRVLSVSSPLSSVLRSPLPLRPSCFLEHISPSSTMSFRISPPKWRLHIFDLCVNCKLKSLKSVEKNVLDFNSSVSKRYHKLFTEKLNNCRLYN